MVEMPITGIAQLRKIVSTSRSDTLIAQRMREACGLGHMNAERRKREHRRGDNDQDRGSRYYERLMKNRYCDLG